MIVSKKYQFPDSCPIKCPGQDEDKMQGGICHRCPVFNCSSMGLDEDGFDIGPMVAPEDYREDWAEEFLHYINEGVWPELPLRMSDGKENVSK